MSCASHLRSLAAVTTLLLSGACSPAPLAPPVTQAQAVSQSKAAGEAKEYAPSAFGEAEKLRAEALYLHKEKRHAESEAAGQQALAAYEQAFALARLARAKERRATAEAKLSEAQARLDELDALHARVDSDAERFELQARVHLDREEVQDVSQLSPERARARRTVALRLAADARVLCHATALLDHDDERLSVVLGDLAALEADLATGSARKDMFPRASSLRAACLAEITRARRPLLEKAPESHHSDALLAALSARGEWMVYRDDRGVVVNVGSPLNDQGELTTTARETFAFLGQVAARHEGFPLLLVVHTKRSGQTPRAETMARLAGEALERAGAEGVTQVNVDDAQPAVFSSMRGANEVNERIEVVFVQPGR